MGDERTQHSGGRRGPERSQGGSSTSLHGSQLEGLCFQPGGGGGGGGGARPMVGSSQRHPCDLEADVLVRKHFLECRAWWDSGCPLCIPPVSAAAKGKGSRKAVLCATGRGLGAWNSLATRGRKQHEGIWFQSSSYFLSHNDQRKRYLSSAVVELIARGSPDQDRAQLRMV